MTHKAEEERRQKLLGWRARQYLRADIHSGRKMFMQNLTPSIAICVKFPSCV
jgi:hypothetical protein